MQLRLVTVLGLSLTSSIALAEEVLVTDVAPVAPAPEPGLTLPGGMFALSVAAQADVSAGAMADMISLAPDVAFGVTDDLTVALVHSVANATGFWSGHSNGSLCIMGEACGDVYSNGALLSKLGLRRGALAVAALGGVIYNIDPFLLGLGAGAEAQYTTGKVALHVKPTIYVGLNKRDGMTPNKEFVNVPFSVLHATTPALQLGMQTGIAAPVEGFADAYRVPVAVIGNYAVMPGLGASLAFSLDRVTGGGTMAGGALDARSLTLTVGWVK